MTRIVTKVSGHLTTMVGEVGTLFIIALVLTTIGLIVIIAPVLLEIVMVVAIITVMFPVAVWKEKIVVIMETTIIITGE